MKPTIVEGDKIFVNKLAYDLKIPFTTVRVAEWAEPERGDIIVFWSPKDDKRLIKRVIAGPGDEVSMLNNVVFVNGVRSTYERVEHDEVPQLDVADAEASDVYQETTIDHKRLMMVDRRLPAITSFAPVIVPDDTWFFLGDNRHNSLDSRVIGCATRDSILGRATAVIASFDRDNTYLPRKGRLLQGLR